MDRRPGISDAYKKPIMIALVWQAILGVLSMAILDTGRTAIICLIAVIAFWSGISIMIIRRPKNPSKLDLLLIRAGFLPTAVATFFIIHWILKNRGLE